MRPSRSASVLMLSVESQLSDYRTFWRARESVLDARLRLPDDRGVAHIVDDLQDAIAGHRPAKGPRRDQAGRARLLHPAGFEWKGPSGF
jgi:hypothetical protein